MAALKETELRRGTPAVRGTGAIRPQEVLMWNTVPTSPTTVELEEKDKIDPVELEILFNRISSIIYEGKEVMTKVGVTPGMSGADLNTGVYNSRGDMVVAGHGVHIHAASGQGPIKYFLKYFKDSVGAKDGDLFYVTDPFLGGTHANDQVLVSPVFDGDELVCWVGAGCHQSDIGATEIGMPVSAKSRYDDGMNLTTIKIGENLKIREDLLYAMGNMTRDPRSFMLDIKARYAAVVRMRQEISKVIKEKGRRFVIGSFRRFIDDTAEVAKKKISKFNDGKYRGVVFIDSIGYKSALLRQMVTLYKKGDKITIDWTGTSPENPGSFNSYIFSAVGSLLEYLIPYLFSDLTTSQGMFAPFEFVVPEKCIMNASVQQSVSMGIKFNFSGTVALNDAFSKMIFDSDAHDIVCASQPWALEIPQYLFVNQRGLGTAGVTMDMNSGGGGARVAEDGVHTQNGIWAAMVDSLETEWFEKDYPFVYIFRKHAEDVCGFGKFRGGAGYQSGFVTHDIGGIGEMASMGAGHLVPTSHGIFGGYGSFMGPGVYIWNSNVEELLRKGEELPKSVKEVVKNRKIAGEYYIGPKTLPFTPLKEGHFICVTNGGGGGYGDVLERAPEKVMEDLKEGIISEWTAKNVYKVGFEPETFTVDFEKTEELRKGEREDRKKRGKKYEDFQKEWLKLKPKDEILEFFGPWEI